MKTFVVVVSSLAIASLALADPPGHARKGKKRAQADAPAPAHVKKATPRIGAKGGAHARQKARSLSTAPFGRGGGAQVRANKFHTRQFNFANKKSNIAKVKFRSGSQITASHNWHGAKYDAFRRYRAEWHDRHWWRHHHHKIVFVYGGWYYWDAGWWYPAWGYDPGAVYYYDGPIYAYNDLPPDQVVANVQSALQEQGYYYGEIDGILGPLTRAALARYQQDRGLYITSAIDEPTLEALGMV